MLIPYKMVSYHSLQCEAMIHLKWGALQEWLRLDDQRYCLLDLNRHIHDLLEAAKHDDKVHVQSIVELVKQELLFFHPLWAVFDDNMGPTAMYWSMFIDMVPVMTRYIEPGAVT